MGSYYLSDELTREEAASFFADFYSLELAAVVILEVYPNNNYTRLRINLKSLNTFFELLDASLRDGNLSQKWGKKFKKIE